MPVRRHLSGSSMSSWGEGHACGNTHGLESELVALQPLLATGFLKQSSNWATEQRHPVPPLIEPQVWPPAQQ